MTHPERGRSFIVTADVIVPVVGTPIHDGYVAVADGRIDDIGPRAAMGATDATIVALPGCAVFPGLIDTHCHLEWSATTLTGGDGTFADWLRQIMRAGQGMGPDGFLEAAREGARRALLSGTTTVLDSGPTGAAAYALAELGMRGVVHLETFGRHTGDAARSAARDLAGRIAALPSSSRVAIGVSPHAPYTVGRDHWTALMDDPDLTDRPWMTHLAESAEELPAVCGLPGPMRDLFRERDSTPGRWPGDGSVVRRLATAGALSSNMVAAHCVHVSADDIALLAAADVGIAHCPVSNTTLGVGTHPLMTARAGGVSVGLGTDSPASGGRYDLRHEARVCRQVHAPASPDAYTLVAMLTIDAARACGRQDDIGSIEVGKRADLVAIPVADEDPAETLLRSESPPSLVMIDGVIRVRDGRIVGTGT